MKRERIWIIQNTKYIIQNSRMRNLRQLPFPPSWSWKHTPAKTTNKESFPYVKAFISQPRPQDRSSLLCVYVGESLRPLGHAFLDPPWNSKPISHNPHIVRSTADEKKRHKLGDFNVCVDLLGQLPSPLPRVSMFGNESRGIQVVQKSHDTQTVKLDSRTTNSKEVNMYFLLCIGWAKARLARYNKRREICPKIKSI